MLIRMNKHARCIHFTEVNWILDDAVNQMLYSDFLLFHSKMMMMKSTVHWNFDAHDTLENMAQCINSFDILGKWWDIWNKNKIFN